MSQKNEKPVLVSIRNRTGVVELNRPQALNSLNLEMVEIIAAALKQWRDNDDVEQVLVYSNHPKAFCAGGDVRAVREGILAGKNEEVFNYFQKEYGLDAQIADYPKPFISVIDGVVMGGGLGLSAHGSHRIVTDKAFAAMPEMAIGYITDVGMAYFSQRMVGTLGRTSPELAKFWGVTGYRMYAGDMLFSGLATGHVANAGSYIEQVIDKGVDNVPVSTSVAEPAPLEEKLPHIEQAFQYSTWDKILENLEFSLLDEVEELVAGACPTSLVAALALYDYEAGVESVQEALAAEYRLGMHLVQRPDFAEGVRAVLIDKTRDADFQPATVAEVDRGALVSLIEG